MCDEYIAKHYELMNSGRWRVDRSQPEQVFYYPVGTVHPIKMTLNDAFKMEKILQEWARESNERSLKQ